MKLYLLRRDTICFPDASRNSLATGTSGKTLGRTGALDHVDKGVYGGVYAACSEGSQRAISDPKGFREVELYGCCLLRRQRLTRQ